MSRRRHVRASHRVLVSLRRPFVDARGTIQNLVDRSCGSALVIESVKGAVRGNHYHKRDFHYSWLHRGRMIYYSRPVGDQRPPRRKIIRAGQLFYTPPMTEHAMVFTEDSLLFVVAKQNRHMRHYEADTTRIASLVPSA